MRLLILLSLLLPSAYSAESSQIDLKEVAAKFRAAGATWEAAQRTAQEAYYAEVLPLGLSLPLLKETGDPRTGDIVHRYNAQVLHARKEAKNSRVGAAVAFSDILTNPDTAKAMASAEVVPPAK